jgi:hypothetical protein
MTIASFDDGVLGMVSFEYFQNAASSTLVAGRAWTPFYTARVHGPAVAPTPGVAGAALTSYSGQMTFPASVGGETIHLAKFHGLSSAQAGTLLLCDRLWHNSGLSVTLTTSQTVNSVAFPARDDNESTDGEGVLVALEISAATGAGTPTLTLGYTNQSGTASRTANNIVAVTASGVIGTTYIFGLQAGDTGVRSIQTYQQSATMTSGTHHLVAFRILEQINLPAGGIPDGVNLLTGGLKRCWDNTVPYLLFIPSATTSTILAGSLAFSRR